MYSIEPWDFRHTSQSQKVVLVKVSQNDPLYPSSNTIDKAQGVKQDQKPDIGQHEKGYLHP